MFPTLVSLAATALLLGSNLAAAIDLNIDDASMRPPPWQIVPSSCADLESSIDQECSRNDSLRYDDILQRKSEWWNPRSAARPPAESTDRMYVSRRIPDVQP
jgi:hypothetical protein